MRDKSTYIYKCKKFIDSVGGLVLAKDLKMSAQVVWNWRRRGIPNGWSHYLAATYRREWVKAGLTEEDI